MKGDRALPGAEHLGLTGDRKSGKVEARKRAGPLRLGRAKEGRYFYVMTRPASAHVYSSNSA
jgi:hypothetical protein